MLFSELLGFHCFQWKLQVPRFWMYSMKGLTCATLKMLHKEACIRDKSSPLFSTRSHSFVIKSPLTVREIMLMFCMENCSVPDRRVVRNLKQLLDHKQSTMVHSPSTWPEEKWEKQSSYPALLWGSCQQSVPSRKWTLNATKHLVFIFISYTKS